MAKDTNDRHIEVRVINHSGVEDQKNFARPAAKVKLKEISLEPGDCLSLNCEDGSNSDDSTRKPPKGTIEDGGFRVEILVSGRRKVPVEDGTGGSSTLTFQIDV